MSRPHPCATILVAVTALLAGCVPGLAADPRFATNSGARPQAGIQLDCANYDADLDPVNGGGGALSIGVVRARSNQTPRDAGPLVFTTGSLPSSAQLPV